jgi:hypothetical protein
MSVPPVTAVIVTYNSRDVVGDALAGLERAHRRALLDCIVVDNGSADGSADFVRSAFPWVTVIEGHGNIGFGRGCNLALRAARTPYVLFLNPDAVLEPDDLAVLVRHMDAHPRAVLSAPAIRIADSDHMQAAGGLPNTWTFLTGAAGRMTPRRRPIQPGEPAYQTDWLSGGIMLGRRGLLNQLGGFDPRFFLYYDETDLCRRAVDAGMEIWAVGEARARHVGGTSAKTSNRLMIDGCIAEHYFRSRFYYIVKHHGYLSAVTVELGELAMIAARSFYKMILRRPGGWFLERIRSPIMRMPDKPVPNEQPRERAVPAHS